MQIVTNKYWESAPRGTRKWYGEFVKSERFNELTEEQKFHSENIIMTFAETVYHFEFQTPQEWDDHGVMCCCPGIFSIRPVRDERFIRSVVPVLAQFFEFLYEKGYKEDGNNLAGITRELELKILRNWERSKNWLDQELG